MARFAPTIDIWNLTREERARLQVGQHVRAGNAPDASKGVWCGARPGSDVVAWSGNSKGRFAAYTKALRDYARALPCLALALVGFSTIDARAHEMLPNTFNLVATTWGQQVNGYVIDSGLSGADCIAALEARPSHVELMPGLVVATETISLACELEGLGVEL